MTGDKGKGVLGEADLNLCDYSEGEFRYVKLPLKGCADSEAYVEVGLKATQVRDKNKSSSIVGSLTQGE